MSAQSLPWTSNLFCESSARASEHHNKLISGHLANSNGACGFPLALSYYADCSTHVIVSDRMISCDGSRGYTATPLYSYSYFHILQIL